jgi:hypothetical protein
MENPNNTNTDKKIVFNESNGKLEKPSSKNRIKHMSYEHKETKKRLECDKWHISEDCLLANKQVELIKEVLANDYKFTNSENKLIIQQIERKISGYKQQDVDKKFLDIEKLVTLKHIINSLVECGMKCYYCSSEMFVLYEAVREHKQWTVDRDNNDLGHNYDNYVLACLECNLKRRRRTKDAYYFTKNLNIVKQDNPDNKDN